MEHTQQKKNNLKIIISDNSNDEIEPSTSGSKVSQNTPSNSPLTYIYKDKNENKKILLNKGDKNIIEDEELFKVTPHFINENKASCESLKGKNILKNPIIQNMDRCKKVKAPLTCDNRCFSDYKFNFNFETRGSGVIVPKEKNKNEEKKIKKISNTFRIGNKNKDKNNHILKQDYSSNKIYSRKSRQNQKMNHSPISSSLISLKYDINQTSPQKIKQKSKNNKNKLINDHSHINIRNNRNCIINDNQKNIKSSRPKSVKCISPQKKNLCHVDNINDISKNKQNNNIKKKKSSHSVNKNIILPNLPEKKIIYVKNQLETEFKNLVKILPDNYEEYPEIKNNLDLIFQNIYGLKDYIHRKTQYLFRPKKNEK